MVNGSTTSQHDRSAQTPLNVQKEANKLITHITCAARTGFRSNSRWTHPFSSILSLDAEAQSVAAHISETAAAISCIPSSFQLAFLRPKRSGVCCPKTTPPKFHGDRKQRPVPRARGSGFPKTRPCGANRQRKKQRIPLRAMRKRLPWAKVKSRGVLEALSRPAISKSTEKKKKQRRKNLPALIKHLGFPVGRKVQRP
uniref:Uncharacterized protein n=1 Tax=Steinernema glaseri TaxID=37863 RepID=A0A1I7Y3I1_9BILA